MVADRQIPIKDPYHQHCWLSMIAVSLSLPACSGPNTRDSQVRPLMKSDAALDADGQGDRAEVTPSEIFERERRDEAFAAPREALLRRITGRLSMRTEISGAKALCKATTCMIRIDFFSRVSRDLAGELQRLPWGGEVLQVSYELDHERSESRAMILYPLHLLNIADHAIAVTQAGY
jgi:hypothetical protein